MMWLPNKIPSHSGAIARRMQMHLATKNYLPSLQSSPICMASQESPSTRFSSQSTWKSSASLYRHLLCGLNNVLGWLHFGFRDQLILHLHCSRSACCCLQTVYIICQALVCRGHVCLVTQASGDIIMQLYHHPLSLNSHKARLALEEKNLDYTPIRVNPLKARNLDPDFFRQNTHGTLPVLRNGSMVLCESLPILQ